MNSASSTNWQPMLLTRVFDSLSADHKLAYAHISTALDVIWASSDLREFLTEPNIVIEGRPLSDLFWEFVGAEAELNQLLTGKRSAFQILRVNRQKPDQTIKYLDFLVAPLNISKPEEGLLLIIEDVTRTGRLEQELVQDRNELRLAQAELDRANTELKRLDRLKSLFLSISAHDLRAPLSAIGGYTDLILTSSLGLEQGEQIDYLHTIRSLVDQLDRLIGDILDLDSIEKGKLSVDLVRCDLNPIVKEVVDTIRGDAQRHNLQVKLTLPKREVIVTADRARIQQILHNLLSNAIKFTPEGGIIEVSTRSNNHCGYLRVSDSGVGIPEAELDRIFDLYYRTEESQNRQVRGKGLGLYIVKSLVEAQGGQIEVTNRPEGGTAFTICFPSIQDMRAN